MKPISIPVLPLFPFSALTFSSSVLYLIITLLLVQTQTLFTSTGFFVHSLLPTTTTTTSRHYNHYPTVGKNIFLPSQHFSTSTRPRTRARPESNLHLLVPDLDGEPFLTIANSYSSALEEQPFITKACTGFFLCGSGDVLAQFRARGKNDPEIDSFEPGLACAPEPFFDYARLLRFASKGFFGTLLWAFWYDISDVLIQDESILSALESISIRNPSEFTVNTARTVSLILAEQFITCPLIYGLWEIPVSTLLNGASPKKIPYEVQSKIVPMLIDNAKIWTWANLVIYNVPLQYRAICGNIMDILWQSIVADYAADCGKEECLLVDEEDRRSQRLNQSTNLDEDADPDANIRKLIQIPIKNDSLDSNKGAFRKKTLNRKIETTKVIR